MKYLSNISYLLFRSVKVHVCVYTLKILLNFKATYCLIYFDIDNGLALVLKSSLKLSEKIHHA